MTVDALFVQPAGRRLERLALNLSMGSVSPRMIMGELRKMYLSKSILSWDDSSGLISAWSLFGG